MVGVGRFDFCNDFGAKADSSREIGGGTDNTAAWTRMLEKIRSTTAPGLQSREAGELFIPKGNYRFASNIEVPYGMRITGTGNMYQAGSTRFIFDKFCNFKVKPYGTASALSGAPSGLRGEGLIVDGLQFVSAHNLAPAGGAFTRWKKSTAYVVDDVVCLREGWKQRYGYALRCTVAGTSSSDGTAPPAPPDTYPLDTTPIVDGTVTWVPFYLPGVDWMATAIFSNCHFRGFPGNGVSQHASVFETGSEGSCSFSMMYDCKFEAVGGWGVGTWGNDSNSSAGIGLVFDDCRSGGIYSESLVPNTWDYCRFQNLAGPAFRSSNSILLHAYMEGGEPPSVITEAGAVIDPTSIGGGGGPIYGDVPYVSGRYPNVNPYTSWASLPATVAEGTMLDPGNGYFYLAVVGGARGGAQPAWDKGFQQVDWITGDYVADGAAIKWVCFGSTIPSTGRLVANNLNEPMTFENVMDVNAVQFRAAGSRTTGGMTAFDWGGGTKGDIPEARWGMSWDETALAWRLLYNSDGNYIAMKLITPTAVDDWVGGTYPAIAHGSPLFQQGFLFGGNDSSKPIFVDAGTSAPTSGVWRVGWYRRNSSPTPGGVLEWVCTTAGDFAGVPPVFTTLTLS